MLLLHVSDLDETAWKKRLREMLDGYPIVVRGDTYDPSDIRYIFVWKPKEDAFDGLTNLKAILSLGAGVDALLHHPKLPKAPIVRFVQEELTQCMTDYVVANVTMHHRFGSRYRRDQVNRDWRQDYPPPAWDVRVGIMGLGALGVDAVSKFKMLGYDVRGWSRNAKTIEGVQTFSGTEQFQEFVSGTDILVNLLPLTPQTEGILNYQTFSMLRRDGLMDGPVIVNAARGGHQNEPDIVRALKDGTLGAASLDVFVVEPLPKNSPLWTAPNCYITPHIAAVSNPDTGAPYFAKIILDHEAGKPLINVIDAGRGY